LNKENLFLIADGDISLYKVDKDIIDNLDGLLGEFYKWKKKKKIICYDETLFVKYLKSRLGENSIEYVRVVGCYAGNINQRTGLIEDKIEEKFKDTKWYNF
jgi:hypothetical protein